MNFTTRLAFLFLLVTMSINAGAQPNGYRQRGPRNTIKGKVLAANTGGALEFATVALYGAVDSALVTGGITDLDGSFSLEAIGASFFLEIEYIGYEKEIVSDIKFERGGASEIDLGEILVSAGGINLDAIEVTAERSELQFALDKRVFNVGKDLSSAGGNAQDVLNNIPSVSVGVEGEVELRGNTNVRILINGRPSGLLGVGDNDGLRNIQSSMIERVEIITNPSAKFEAEGMAGIINIILKQERAKGFNGSFEVTAGSPLSYGAGANINYRQDRFNFFINGNHNKRTGPATGNTYQEFYKGDTTNISFLTSRRNRNGNNTSIQAGSDYYLSDKEVLTAAFLYKFGRDNNSNFVEYRDTTIFQPKGAFTRPTIDQLDNYILRTDDELEEEPTLEFSLNYDKKFKKKGHELKASFSFQDNVEEESSALNESLYRGDNLLSENVFRQRTTNKEGQGQLRTQVDYVRPMENKVKVEIGLLGNFRTIDNDFKVESEIDGTFEIEQGLTNNFIYKEDVAAAYANYGQDLDKFSYQVGLRGEWSFISTTLVNTNEVNDRNYLNLFPSLFASYKFNPTNTIQASYSRRISRPRFWDLNPFFTLTDRRNFFSGNPDVNPEFTDSYEVTHLKFWNSGNIGSSIYYRRTTDLITRILLPVPGSENETLRRPENIGIEQNYGAEIVWGYSAIKWLKLDGGINAFFFDVDGVAEQGEVLSVSAAAWDAKFNSRLSFWENASLQTRVNYRSPQMTVQGTRQSITSVDLAASKDFLSNNLTVTLSVRDLFNNRRRQSTTETENFFEDGNFQWRPRTFTATINYRINAKKQRPRREGYQGGEGF